MIAYCGLDCATCPAHLAWKTNDNKLREKQAVEWGSPEYLLIAKDIDCVGCKVDAEPKFKYCDACSVKTCASECGVETCAHCDDYGCDTLKAWFAQMGDTSRQRLEKIRASL